LWQWTVGNESNLSAHHDASQDPPHDRSPRALACATLGAGVVMDDRTRHMLLTLRAALLMALGAIEDALGLPRTLPPRRERREARASYPTIDP
jgi:hypothetical protein